MSGTVPDTCMAFPLWRSLCRFYGVPTFMAFPLLRKLMQAAGVAYAAAEGTEGDQCDVAVLVGP